MIIWTSCIWLKLHYLHWWKHFAILSTKSYNFMAFTCFLLGWFVCHLWLPKDTHILIPKNIKPCWVHTKEQLSMNNYQFQQLLSHDGTKWCFHLSSLFLLQFGIWNHHPIDWILVLCIGNAFKAQYLCFPKTFYVIQKLSNLQN